MKHILIVEDELDISEALKVALEGEGYRVSECNDSREAVSCVRSLAPDLIMLDIMMPYIDGMQILRTLKQTPELEKIPVLMMSCAPPPSKGAKWDAFLAKPFDLDRLLETVTDLCSQ